MKIMTFLTDFGYNNNYICQMKSVALSITDAKIVDLNHNISPHNISEAAFILSTSIKYFPIGTVHIAVVDPGVGTKRRGIVVTTRKHVFVGPDNGLLIPAARSQGVFSVYEIKNPNLMLNNISNTFHGRDIFTPVGAHILNGLMFDQIGPIINDYVDLKVPSYQITDKTATGNVIYIDSFGNIITNIEGTNLLKFLKYDNKIMLFIGDKQIELPFVKSYNYVKSGEFLSTIGSNNFFEISINQGNAAQKLKINENDELKILFN